MDAEGYLRFKDDDELDPLIDLVERAEKYVINRRGDKYWATLDEILLLAGEAPSKVYQDIGGNWIIEIVYERITFIHATSFQAFTGCETVH